MRKFFAVVKREYFQRVRTKFFVVATILGPLVMAGFTVVPALMFSIKSGGPTRLAIVDQTGQMYERIAKEITTGQRPSERDSQTPPQSLANNNPRERAEQAARLTRGTFQVEQVTVNNRALEEIRKSLEAKVQNREIDGYLIVPVDILEQSQAEFRARNAADLFTANYLERALGRAVRGQRLANSGIDETTVEKASEPVKLKTVGEGGRENKGESNFFLVLGLALMIYMSVLLYGQFVLGAVIEEKETRIAEILFSSMRSFPLMIGKLIGVCLLGLTQMGIWTLAFLGFSVWAGGTSASLPHIAPVVSIYFILFFLMGFLIYATIYAVVGSMVTTTQEGGQLALPVVMMLVATLILSFNVVRSPNSSLAFWASLFPFSAPITMLVRIVTETPPFWQILLSFGIGIATVAGLIWLASRIYRVGMLMYGKKATIPEVLRWIRQA